MKVIDFTVKDSSFFAHMLEGTTGKMIIFLPGLGEPKSGLFYIWSQMAFEFNQRGHNCLLFDLAGQGESTLQFSLQTWKDQVQAIVEYFSDLQLIWIARGLSASILPREGIGAAINPSMKKSLAPSLQKLRWKPSLLKQNSLTPAFPNSLTEDEIDCFHMLGAEAECIGGLEVPSTFASDVLEFIPDEFPKTTKCYHPKNVHPLYDKLAERQLLTSSLIRDLGL